MMRPRHPCRRDRKLCRRCGDHPALFQTHGHVKWDRDHDLCKRCWQSLYDRVLAVGAGRR